MLNSFYWQTSGLNLVMWWFFSVGVQNTYSFFFLFSNGCSGCHWWFKKVLDVDVNFSMGQSQTYRIFAVNPPIHRNLFLHQRCRWLSYYDLKKQQLETGIAAEPRCQVSGHYMIPMEQRQSRYSFYEVVLFFGCYGCYNYSCCHLYSSGCDSHQVLELCGDLRFSCRLLPCWQACLWTELYAMQEKADLKKNTRLASIKQRRIWNKN